MFIRSLLFLGALWCSVSAETAGALHERSDLSPRQTRQCLNSGWIPVCPGGLPCIPPSGTCCSGGYYHLPGGTCPRGTVEVPRIGQSASVPSITPAPTPSPTPAPPVVAFTWYTYTITYYYYYYYYYYFAATYQLTSTRTTYFTTISLSATNEVAASSALASVSAAISFVPPSQAATPTLGSVPAATSTPALTPSSSKAPYPTGNVTLPSSSPPPQFTGAATSLRAGSISGVGGVFLFAVGALMAAPGLLMLTL